MKTIELMTIVNKEATKIAGILPESTFNQKGVIAKNTLMTNFIKVGDVSPIFKLTNDTTGTLGHTYSCLILGYSVQSFLIHVFNSNRTNSIKLLSGSVNDLTFFTDGINIYFKKNRLGELRLTVLNAMSTVNDLFTISDKTEEQLQIITVM